MFGRFFRMRFDWRVWRKLFLLCELKVYFYYNKLKIYSRIWKFLFKLFGIVFYICLDEYV